MPLPCDFANRKPVAPTRAAKTLYTMRGPCNTVEVQFLTQTQVLAASQPPANHLWVLSHSIHHQCKSPTPILPASLSSPPREGCNQSHGECGSCGRFNTSSSQPPSEHAQTPQPVVTRCSPQLTLQTAHQHAAAHRRWPLRRCMHTTLYTARHSQYITQRLMLSNYTLLRWVTSA